MRTLLVVFLCFTLSGLTGTAWASEEGRRNTRNALIVAAVVLTGAAVYADSRVDQHGDRGQYYDRYDRRDDYDDNRRYYRDDDYRGNNRSYRYREQPRCSERESYREYRYDERPRSRSYSRSSCESRPRYGYSNSNSCGGDSPRGYGHSGRWRR